MKRLIILISVTMLLGKAPLLAQDSMTYTFSNTNGGLKSNLVNCIEIDSKGLVWVGTLGGGVSIFDGKNWVNYTKENTGGGLISDMIYCIAFDNNGNTWIGSEDGASKFDGKNWTTYTVENTNRGLYNKAVNSIAIDSNGWVWFSTSRLFNSVEHVVSILDGNKWMNITKKDCLLRKPIHCFAKDSTGKVWSGSGYLLSNYDGHNWYYDTIVPLFLYNKGIPNKMAVDKKGTFWVSFSFNDSPDNNDFVYFTVGNDSIHYVNQYTTRNILDNKKQICAIEIDKAGNVWVARLDAIFKYDGKRWKKVLELEKKIKRTQNIEKYPVSLAIQDDNTLWTGTYKGIRLVKE